MKRVITIIMAITAIGLMSCETTQTADKQMEKATAEAMNEANKQIGMPAIVNFQERKLAKMIFELRDQEGLVCYAYIVNHMTGELVFIGKCMGFGLPYSVQYTNPERSEYHSNGGTVTLPQADPNGLFMPEGLSATWLMMVDDKGNARPVYVEPQIIVSPFKLK